jgi:hypothetical protein
VQPQYYVVVKGNTHIIGNEEDEVELSMGLENGIIVLVSKTYENADVFLNGNHMDEELILGCNGTLESGLYQMSGEFETVYRAAVDDAESMPPDCLFGGVIYIHANIPEGFYNYRNSLLTSLFLAALLINNQLHKYTISQIIAQLAKTKIVDQLFL